MRSFALAIVAGIAQARYGATSRYGTTGHFGNQYGHGGNDDHSHNDHIYGYDSVPIKKALINTAAGVGARNVAIKTAILTELALASTDREDYITDVRDRK